MVKKLQVPKVLERRLSKDEKSSLKNLKKERDVIHKKLVKYENDFAKLFRKDSKDKKLKSLGKKVTKYIDNMNSVENKFFDSIKKLEKKLRKKSIKKSKKSVKKSSKKSAKKSKKSTKKSSKKSVKKSMRK